MDEETKAALRRKNKAEFTRSLRRSMTREETIMWTALRDRRSRGIKFRRQVNIGPYIADFLCKQHRVIIEIDGGIHKERTEQDAVRDAYLANLHYRILRIRNEEVHHSLPEVLERIHAFIDLTPTPSPAMLKR